MNVLPKINRQLQHNCLKSWTKIYSFMYMLTRFKIFKDLLTKENVAISVNTK